MGSSLGHCDQRLSGRQYFSNFDGWNSGPIESLRQLDGVLRRNRDQEPTRGLRVKQDRLPLIRNGAFVFHHALGELTIGIEPCRDVAVTHTFERSLKQRDAAGKYSQ